MREYLLRTIQAIANEFGYQVEVKEESVKIIFAKRKVDTLETRKQIIDYLNNKIGAKYKASTDSTVKHINARLNEGYKLEDFYKVIDTKTAEWLGDPKWGRYLRPATLFSPKFENYLNESQLTDANTTMFNLLKDDWNE